jgi:arsenate reductase (glutaredoxin)
MTIKIYHNSRCSKSREALAIVKQFAISQSINVDVIDYLRCPPSIEQLIALQGLLGCRTLDMVRDNEEEFAGLNLEQANDSDLLRAIAAYPKLLQRPIVVYGERAMIGRPPALLNELLKT